MIARSARFACGASEESAARSAPVRWVCSIRVPAVPGARNARNLRFAMALDGMGRLGLPAAPPRVRRIHAGIGHAEVAVHARFRACGGFTSAPLPVRTG